MCSWSKCARTLALLAVFAVAAVAVNASFAQDQPRGARPASVAPSGNALPAQQHPTPEPAEPARPPRPQRNPDGATPPQPPDAPRPEARFEPPVRAEVTIYQLDLRADRVTGLEAAALAKQGTTLADMDKVLNGIGRASVLYRADQMVLPLDHTRIELTSDVPYITAAGVGKEGQRVTSIAREKVGAKLAIFGRTMDLDGRHSLVLNLEINFSGIASSPVESSPDVKAPVFRDVRQSYGGFIDFGKPVIVLSVDGATGAATSSDGATAYITRIVIYPADGAPPVPQKAP